MTELKPCPFCDGKAKLLENDGNRIIRCSSCYASTREFYAYSPESEVIEAWNKRAKNSEEKEWQ